MKKGILATLLAMCTQVHAVEGMWQPHQLPAIEAQLREAGIAVDPKQLSDLTRYPMNAVISLGFCTASFVSPMGLVVTNHHCAYGSIQYASTPERNLLQQGFLANTLGEELPAEPTLRIWVTESIREVTDQVRAGLEDTQDGAARFDAIDRAQKTLVAQCEADKSYRCQVHVFHGGAQYFLVRQLQIRDVRLVYAPASAIGRFGGDVDNWIWPRHTGDFAYYRAYVGPDGKPADYSEANVPYRPKAHLKVQPAGLEEGDFAMIAGYPGRTNRYRLSEEVSDAIEWQYPKLIERLRAALAIIDEQTRGREDAAIKYASNVSQLNNALKNYQGNLDGFRKIDAVAAKAGEERRILEWAAAHDQAAGIAGFEALKAQLAQQRTTRERDQLLTLLDGMPLYAAARDLNRLAIEREKEDALREAGYQQRDEPRLQGRLQQLDRRWDPQVDRALMQWLLGQFIALPQAERIPELDRWIAGGEGEATAGQLAARLDALYAGTQFADADKRMAWFNAKRREIESADDSALAFARALLPAVLRIEAETQQFQGEETRNRPAWMATRIAYAQAQGRELYADANASLRITFGNVQGYVPRDGVRYESFTDLAGIVEKHTGSDPFDATAHQLDAIRERRFGPYAVDGSVPVNFVADLDITGGNSGSPVLNARAELVGLAFDGNYEAISSGWLFNPVLTRTIGVDVRYMLWVMDAVDGAQRLLEEMGLKPAFGR
ncbi:MAG: S46 family peptidase [Xanthomonadales bacterium]|nr:Dipeptidyl aminopeptidase BII [Xanthomonadales bacterium]MCC6591901.1 S46 family peptidase [Xanthomonadales bacterium]MCE7930044.1 S46 family peptidase [Xanthomonadales bacterium PRO6]